eukprot:885654-Pleurochrysis_carterae.AAC.1
MLQCLVDDARHGLLYRRVILACSQLWPYGSEHVSGVVVSEDGTRATASYDVVLAIEACKNKQQAVIARWMTDAPAIERAATEIGHVLADDSF